MNNYSNVGDNSNVTGYDFSDDWIAVQFQDGSIYRYSRESCGQHVIDEMIRLAESGSGLNSYISRYQPSYASKG